MSMWPLAVGMGAVAVTTGFLATPEGRRRVLGTLKQDWLGHELEIDTVDPDAFTVRCKNGFVMRCYQVGGIAYDTKPEQEQFALHERRANFLHQVASTNVVTRFFGVKRHQSINHPAKWPSPCLQEIGDAEAELYKHAYKLSWFITLQAKNLDDLEKADEKIRTSFASYGLTRLHRPEKPHASCDLTGFLNYLTCGELRYDLLPISKNVSANLPGADLIFNHDGLFTAHQPTAIHYRLIAVREWPDSVSGYLLHELMALPGEIEVSQVLVPTNKITTLALLNREAKAQFGTPRKIEESATTAEILQEGETSLLETQFVVVARGRDLNTVNNLVTAACKILDHRRVIYSVETKGTPVCWFNRMPGNEKLLRPLKLLTDAPAALWPFESAPVGLPKTYYTDAPVRSFGTGAGQAYAFQFQGTDADKALGNYLMFAPAGTGKSTLTMHLLGGLSKFDGVRSYVFDSNEGTRFMMENMGGLYQSFDKLALNPLDCEDTAINRQRIKLLMQLMLGDAGQDPDTEETILHTINTAFELPAEARTFNDVFPLAFPKQSPARRAFTQWIKTHDGHAGALGNVLNAQRDSLAGLLDQAFMVGINMNEALEDPVLGPPIVAHISNAIERMARSGSIKAFNIFIDEAANLLRNPAFRDLATVMFREYRKFGGSVGMAFQDPSALHKSGIADAVIENTATLFFFSNPQGNPDAYEPFNLNEEQKNFIFNAPEGRRVLLVKRDAATGINESTILNTDLSNLGNALRFYRSGPEAVRELQAIQKQWGDQWRSHV